MYDVSHLLFNMSENYLVFTGRSNAGKSSIIREIVGLDVATGKRPGTTRQISRYPLAHGLFLVDMPGFGRMMRASRYLEEKVKDQIIRFLELNASKIVLAVHVLDISTFLETTWRLEKKGYRSLDVEMVQFMANNLGEFPLVAANKIDKTDEDELEANLKELKYRISYSHPSTVEDHVFPVSAKTGEGLGALKSAIHDKLVARGYRTPFRGFR